MKKTILFYIMTLGILSACGNANQFSVLSTSSESSSGTSGSSDLANNIATPTVDSNSAAQRILTKLSADLVSGTIVTSKTSLAASAATSKLSTTQIQTILSAASLALQTSGLETSNDLDAVVEAIVSGALSGAGAIQLTDSSAVSALVGAIGTSVLGSVVDLSTVVDAGTLQILTQSLFSNLDLTGIRDSSSIGSVAKSVISTLLSNIATTGLSMDTTTLETVLAGLATGSADGLGLLLDKLGLSSLSTVLTSLASGSFTGITSLVSSIANGSSLLETLVTAFTDGVKTALENLVSSGLTSSSVTSLLTSFLSGLSTTTSSSWLSWLISWFSDNLLSIILLLI